MAGGHAALVTTDVDRAVAARDAASSRVRRTTVLAAAAGAVLAAAFAGLAAGSTHARKTIHQRTLPKPRTKRSTSVQAPAPPLVPVPGSDDGSSQQQSAPQPPAAPPQPAPAYTPPVATSGGS
jgi:type IV secretory pathway VirB10-like protein